MKSHLLLALLLAWPAATVPSPAPEELSKKEAQALVDEYVALDWKSAEGMARGDEILARLEAYPALAKKDLKSWNKRIQSAWEKGPELEKKGSHHLWDEESRGFYIVGGEKKKPKGLFIGMHGGGVGSGDAWNSHGAFNNAASAFDWVAIFPQVLELTEHGWTDSGTEEFVLELVERAVRTWDIDRDRVYFGGHSMGGYGSWTLGAHHADTVAGLTPSAGAPTPYLVAGGRVDGIVEGVIPNLRNVPLVIYQSDDDVQVPPDVNRAAVQELEAARAKWGGYDFDYWEVSGMGHDLPPGGTKALLERIHEKVREPHPERVLWQPALTWKRHFYWLWWDAPVVNAIVLADLDRETNSVDVTLEEADPAGLYVLLSDELLDLEAEVVVRLAGEEVYRGVPERSLAALVATGSRGDERLRFDVRIPLF